MIELNCYYIIHPKDFLIKNKLCNNYYYFLIDNNSNRLNFIFITIIIIFL